MTDRTNHCTGCKERQDRIDTLKQERDKLVEFVNWLIEEHDLEYQGMIANDT